MRLGELRYLAKKVKIAFHAASFNPKRPISSRSIRELIGRLGHLSLIQRYNLQLRPLPHAPVKAHQGPQAGPVGLIGTQHAVIVALVKAHRYAAADSNFVGRIDNVGHKALTHQKGFKKLDLLPGPEGRYCQGFTHRNILQLNIMKFPGLDTVQFPFFHNILY